MKYEDVLKRFVSTQAQLLQDKQMRQQQREQMLAEKAQALQSFVPGMQGHSPEEEYTESEHNPFEETQEYYDGGEMYGDPPKKNPYRTQVRARNNLTISNEQLNSKDANTNTKFDSSSMIIDDYDDGTPSDTSYMYITPTENVFFSTIVDPETKQKIGQREASHKLSHLTPEERKYYQAKIMQELQRKEDGGEMDGDPPKKKFKPYMLDHDSQVQNVMTQSTSENGSNFNQGFNEYNRTIDVYKNGSPSDTSYMFTSEGHNKPFEQVYFSTQLDPKTKQPRGQKMVNDKFSELTPEERKYYQAKIMQELQKKESGGMFTGDYEYPNGGEFDKPRFSLGMYASPEMGSSVSPSLNFEKGNFNANLSTNIPIETPDRYSKNLNIDANYNTGKFGNIGVSGSAYRNEEGLPAYNAGLRYELPITDKLNFMLNADTSSFKNLKDNANVSAGLRYTFEEGGGNTKTVKSKDGTITNVKQNADGSKTVQVRTKDGKYSEKVIPMDYWNKLENLNNGFKEDERYEDILEFVDPTGISSYDDVQRAYNKNGLFDDETMLEIAGALPIIGKFGKLAKGLKVGSDLFKEYKLSKMLRGIDAVGKTKQAADIVFREGGSFNNPGFNALPEAVQDKIIAAMMYGGSFNNNNWD